MHKTPVSPKLATLVLQFVLDVMPEITRDHPNYHTEYR